jgi:hypothetical protein
LWFAFRLPEVRVNYPHYHQHFLVYVNPRNLHRFLLGVEAAERANGLRDQAVELDHLLIDQLQPLQLRKVPNRTEAVDPPKAINICGEC